MDQCVRQIHCKVQVNFLGSKIRQQAFNAKILELRNWLVYDPRQHSLHNMQTVDKIEL